jgi:hypothetical protein
LTTKRKKLGRISVLTYLSSRIWASPAQTLVNAAWWWQPSKPEYVEAGIKFAERYEQMGITNLRCSVKQS